MRPRAVRRAGHSTRLVSVVVGLVRAVDGETEVVGLLGREGGELDVELGAVGSGDLLVERLREHAAACQRHTNDRSTVWTYWTPRGYEAPSVQRAIWAMTWLENEQDMTAESATYLMLHGED